jgi:Family of unknown function (DUF6551)
MRTALSGEGRYVKLSLEQLTTDPRFNRPVRDHKVRRILSEFTPRAFHAISAWLREDGKYVVLDGQHRVEALRRLGVPENARVIHTIVHEDLSLDQAAELFVLLNDSYLVNAYDKYRALLVAGHSETVDIARIMSEHGLAVSASGKKDGQVTAIMSLRHVYRMNDHGELLERTLDVLKRAWQDQAEAYSAALIRGIGLYLSEHPDVAFDTLADAIVRTSGAPINLIGRAKAIAGPTRMSLSEAIALTLEQQVMRRRRRPRATEGAA